jgi:uncharacterized membrane protein
MVMMMTSHMCYVLLYIVLDIKDSPMLLDSVKIFALACLLSFTLIRYGNPLFCWFAGSKEEAL